MSEKIKIVTSQNINVFDILDPKLIANENLGPETKLLLEHCNEFEALQRRDWQDWQVELNSIKEDVLSRLNSSIKEEKFTNLPEIFENLFGSSYKEIYTIHREMINYINKTRSDHFQLRQKDSIEAEHSARDFFERMDYKKYSVDSLVSEKMKEVQKNLDKKIIEFVKQKTGVEVVILR